MAAERIKRVSLRPGIGRRDDRDVHTAERLQRGGGRLSRGVHDVVSPQLLRQIQLLIGHVDGNHGGTGDLGVLHGKMTEAPDAEHCDEIGRAGT